MKKIKRCPRCGKEKILTDFYKNRREKDGLSCWCKGCHAEYAKEYRKTEKGRLTNLKAVRKYQNTPKGREVLRAAVRKYQAKEKEL